VYRRLEARGEIRGGRFVAGVVGEQFAQAGDAVDALRLVRRLARPEAPSAGGSGGAWPPETGDRTFAQ